MKARVKATGEIIEVVKELLEFTNPANGSIYSKDELEFEEYHIPRRMTLEKHLEEISSQMGKFTGIQSDSPDYWERLKHQYAGMAMQGLCANKSYNEHDWEIVAEDAMIAATALVEKMKEERK